MSNTARTNNICEGWNNGFANLVGQQQPSLWKLIENLRKEEARVHVRVVQDERGVRVHKRKRRVYEELQKRLKNLLDDLIGGRKDIPQFLRVLATTSDLDNHIFKSLFFRFHGFLFRGFFSVAFFSVTFFPWLFSVAFFTANH